MPEGEDELMLVAGTRAHATRPSTRAWQFQQKRTTACRHTRFAHTGERVVPLKALTSRCWIAACNTMVGIVDPRHLLNLSVAGLTAVPDWSAAK